jgi:hypothetical protein
MHTTKQQLCRDAKDTSAMGHSHCCRSLPCLQGQMLLWHVIQVQVLHELAMLPQMVDNPAQHHHHRKAASTSTIAFLLPVWLCSQGVQPPHCHRTAYSAHIADLSHCKPAAA